MKKRLVVKNISERNVSIILNNKRYSVEKKQEIRIFVDSNFVPKFTNGLKAHLENDLYTEFNGKIYKVKENGGLIPYDENNTNIKKSSTKTTKPIKVEEVKDNEVKDTKEETKKEIKKEIKKPRRSRRTKKEIQKETQKETQKEIKNTKEELKDIPFVEAVESQTAKEKKDK